MVLTTYGDVKKHLLEVIDFATYHPTVGNKTITKKKYWNLTMNICLQEDDSKECGEMISTTVLEEFPEHLRADFATGEGNDEFYDESYIGL